MLRSENGKVYIKGLGKVLLRDLCAAARAVRDALANNIDKERASVLVLTTIAKTLGVDFDIEEVEPDA